MNDRDDREREAPSDPTGRAAGPELEGGIEPLERMADAFYAVDDEWRFTYLNDQAETLLDRERSSLLGRRLWDVFPEVVDTKLESAFREAMRSQEHADFGFYHDASEMLFDVSVYPSASGLSVYFRDVTERFTYEHQLASLHETTRQVMQAETKQAVADAVTAAARDIISLLTHAIWFYSEERDALEPVATTEAASDLFESLPTFEAGEGIAWQVYESGTARTFEDVRTAEERYNPETPIRSEVILPLGEHGIFIAGATSVDAFDDEQVSLAKILASNAEVAIDRIEQHRSLQNRERELAEQNKRLDKFASIVSHDLRNPLSVAKGRLELARGDCDSAHLDSLGDALEHMERLTSTLLTVARSDGAVEDPTPVPLSAIAERAWDHVDPPGATLRVVDDITVTADATGLTQLLENLFRNSVEHAGADVTVTVGPLADSGFYVEDDGPGVPDTDRGKLFEMGYSTQPGGTGLGLAIVERIVAAHEWDVSVGEGADGGARFEIATSG
jgi:signal transduction histidine kinase